MPAPDSVDPTQAGARTMRDFLATREAERQTRAAARHAAISHVLNDLVAILSADGAQRVWVFGSFAQGPFDEHSDLDLATEGLPPHHYFTVRAALSEVCPVRFDLVELERAPPALREEILAHGRLLHDTASGPGAPQ